MLRRSSLLVSVVALLLAVLLPLTAAHCLFMGVPGTHGTHGAALHACCQKAAARAASSHARHGESSRMDCCAQLPSGVSVAKAELPAPHMATLALAAQMVLAVPSPVRVARANVHDHDPPGAPPSAAHLLRGPPARA